MKKVFRFLLVLLCLLTLSSCNLFKSRSNKSSGKEELSLDALKSNTSFYKYTGQPVTIENDIYFLNKEGRRANGATFDYTYENNIDPGTATAYITAKDDNQYFKGTVTYHFEIRPADEGVDITTFEELKIQIANPKVRFFNVVNDITIPQGETITIKKDIDLRVSQTVNTGTGSRGSVLTNRGTIVIEAEGFLQVGGKSGYASSFYNYGTINNSGNISSLSDGRIYNMGNINNNGTVEVYCILYSNNHINNVSKNSKGKYIERTRVSNSDLTFNSSVRYNENHDLNKVAIYAGGKYVDQRQIEYSSYDKVGTAHASITFSDTDENFYGSASIDYQIVKGPIAVNTFAELVEKHNSGQFDEYTINSKTSLFTITDSLTIEEDETFKFNVGAIVGGNLINKGTISMEHPTYNTISVGDTYTFTNLGTVICNNGYISGTNLINGSSTVKTSTINGYINVTNLTNYGYINITENKNLNVSGNLINNGTINAPTYLTVLNLENNGTINVPQSFTLSQDGTFINNESGAITFGGDSVFRGTSFNNKGTVNNNGRISLLLSIETINNIGTINNESGSIYAFKSISGVSNNFVLRKLLTIENTTLEYTDVDYNMVGHNPNVLIEGQLDKTEGMTLSIRKKGETSTLKSDPIDAGTYQKTINVWSSFNEYGGSITLEYNINYATAHIGANTSFYLTITNTNYNNFILDTDVEYSTSSQITILAYQTLDLNGHKFIFTGTLNNRGKIIVGKVSELNTLNTLEEVSLQIGTTSPIYNTVFNNYGIIENNGLILVRFDQSKKIEFISLNGSNIVNNGKIYTQENELILDSESTGDIVFRKALAKESDKVTLEYSSVDYNEEFHTPSFTVQYNETELDSLDFDCAYSKNKTIGTAEALISPKSQLNEYYAGYVKKTFVIIRAVKEISTFSGITLDGVNYYKFKLTNDIGAENTVTIPAGTILDLGIYNITNMKVIMGEGATLEVSASTIDRFSKYLYLANKITLINDIGTLGSNFEITYSTAYESYDTNVTTFNNKKEQYATFVYIGSNKINLFSSYYNSYKRQTTYSSAFFKINDLGNRVYEGIKMFDTVIDLNGHNILSNITYNHDKLEISSSGTISNVSLVMNTTFMNSSENTSSIGRSGDTICGFNITGSQSYNGTSNYAFNDVKVYGVSLSIPNLNGNISITANNCVFNQTNKNALLVDNDSNKNQVNSHFTTTFTSCTFNSTLVSAVVIKSGTNTFNDCLISTSSTYDDKTKTGCGVYVYNCGNSSDRNIVVNLGNSTVNSTNGYGILFYSYKREGWTDYVTINYNNKKVTGSIKAYEYKYEESKYA